MSGAHRARPEAWWPADSADVAATHVTLNTGVTVRLLSSGPVSGKPLLMIHGWGIHAYLWRRNMPALVADGYRVYAMDLPGHGLSDKPLEPGSYTVERGAAHVVALLDMLGISQAPIIAQSMGGRIAIEVALRYPSRVSALALFGCVGFGETPKIIKFLPRLHAPRGPVSTMIVRRWMVALGKAIAYGRRAHVAQDDIDAYWATTQFPDFLAALRQALIDFDWQPLKPAVLARIMVPTIVFFGTRDKTVKPVHAETLVAAMPRGQLYWVRDAGHVANEEASEEINPVLRDFLERQ